MKTNKVFVTIDFDNVPGKMDYPQNIPLPRIGETIIFEHAAGTVYDVRHIITGKTADITIKVKQ